MNKRGKHWKIVADQNMPLVEELFGRFGDTVRLPGRDISPEDIRDADVLLIRSVTEVDKQLLDESAVRFVGSATIGTDHVDQDYLAEKGVFFAHAPGCNAQAVVQYDLSVFSTLQPDWRSKKIAIFGCGNVGGKLYKTLKRLGVSCCVYDPFLSLQQVPDLVDFETALQADILCLHTPLTTDGPFPTYHMFNESVLRKLNADSLLINAGRGAVIDNSALLKILEQGPLLKVALDVWENELQLNLELMNRVDLATPHIAGYSVEGKQEGTRMVHRAFCHWLGSEDLPSESPGAKETGVIIDVKTIDQAIVASYNVSLDDQRMRRALQLAEGNESRAVGEVFDQLRKEYPQRHEFSYFSIQGEAESKLAEADEFKAIGFIVG